MESHCPQMNAESDRKASLLPFQLSVSKRHIPQRLLEQHSRLDVHPMIRMLHLDRGFAWDALLDDGGLFGKKNGIPMRNMMQNEPLIVPISKHLMYNLGTKILPNRRTCIAGKMLAGILMPRNTSLQALLLRSLFLYYLPCIEVQGNTFALNRGCFAERENTFLKIYYLSVLAHSKSRYRKSVQYAQWKMRNMM